MTATTLRDADIEQLAARGISPAEARRQLELLRSPPRPAVLDRPCTVGDGIERIPAAHLPALHAAHDEAARAGRFGKFVPASGAATRMFRELLRFRRGPGRELSWSEVRARGASGDADAAALTRFVESIERFPFHDAVARQLALAGEDLAGLVRSGAFQPILDALLGADGLDLDHLPKGLIPFHAYPQGARTPFDEHLLEAAATIRDADGLCRLHFTVSAEHLDRFRERLAGVTSLLGAARDVRFDVGFSVQSPATDTLAVDAAGNPLRDEAGCLVLRPAGHGALIGNLDALEGDLVFIKNIDNVQRDEAREDTLCWKRALGGYLVELEREARRHAAALEDPDATPSRVDEAFRFVVQRLNADASAEPPTHGARRAFVIQRLNRPLRVCGVVPNTGEPGGGPFWVRGSNGAVTPQIVEAAEIDTQDDAQARRLGAATHFNPVDLVCAVRDAAGRPFELHAFVDQAAAIVAHKSAGGRDLRALERPGLWNGAMARWNTIFVEVPLTTFTPVKTVLDLLRPAHLAG